MSKKIASFEGRFQLWTYDVSHARLLLRRPKESGAKTRLDVLFTSVTTLEIATVFDSLTIEELDNNEHAGELSNIEDTIAPGLKKFRITSRGWSGCVVAGSVRWREDDLDCSAPSALYEPGPLMLSLKR